jgi:hypothetical protein
MVSHQSTSATATTTPGDAAKFVVSLRFMARPVPGRQVRAILPRARTRGEIKRNRGYVLLSSIWLLGVMAACVGFPFEAQVARAIGSGWRLEIGPPDQTERQVSTVVHSSHGK